METEREEMGADDSEVSEDMVEVPVDYSEDEPEEEEPDGQEFYAKWTDAYKEAREYLYGTPQIEPDEEAAYEIMKEEAGQGKPICRQTWERCMHRVFLWKQTRRKHRSGMKSL